MNKKIWWSAALAPIAIATPALTVISCSPSSSSQSYQYASSEAGEHNFLSFKWFVSQYAADLPPLPGQNKILEQQILQSFEYDDSHNWGIKKMSVTIDKKEFVIEYEIVVYKGNLIDFPEGGDISAYPKDRETLKGTFRAKSKSF